MIHANQTILYLTPLHGNAQVLKTLIANTCAALRHTRRATEQLNQADRWNVLRRQASHRIALRHRVGAWRVGNCRT